MSSRRIGCGARPSFLALLAMTVTALQAQTTKVIDVNEPRPLWQALDALEIVVGGTVNYEDPPYENVADLQDVSTPQQRAAEPAGYQLLVPRGGRVTAEVQAPAARKAADNDIIFDLNLLLASYRQNKLPGDFKVEQANGMLYVTPTKVLGANGVMRDVTSPMTALVTVPYAQRNVADTTEAILDAVYKATGLRITIGSLPFWPTQMVSFGASGESARDALARLFAQTAGGPLTYRLVFDPRPDRMRTFDYMINVKETGYIGPMAPPGLGPMVVSPPPAATSQQPADSRPGQTKVKQ
jgi:hypothetical protein